MFFNAKSLLAISVLTSATTASYGHDYLGHAVPHPVARRQADPTFSGQSTYTIITPSPGASPVPVTQQYQAVTSFVPVITVCPETLLPAPSASAAFSNSVNASSPTNSCDTSYSPTITTVCYTELAALISKETVSACSQALTFSNKLGYKLLSSPSANVSPAPGSSDAVPIQTITTFYVAPWTDLTSDSPPSTHVTERICSTAADSKSGFVCVDNWVQPRTVVLTSTETSTTTLQVTTDVKGPAKVAIRTLNLDVTDAESNIALSTQFVDQKLKTTTSVEYTVEKTGASTATMALPTGSDSSMEASAAEDSSESSADDAAGSNDSPSSTDPSTSTHTNFLDVYLKKNTTMTSTSSDSTSTTTMTITSTITEPPIAANLPTLTVTQFTLLPNATSRGTNVTGSAHSTGLR